MNTQAIEYEATISHEGFTITKCHYFVLMLHEPNKVIIKNSKQLTISPHNSITHVVFMSNPIHEYITKCRDNNKPIIIKGRNFERPTGFTYIPHFFFNGTQHPLMCHIRNANNTFDLVAAKCNTIRLFINEAELNKANTIIKKEINKLKKFEV